MPVLKDLRKTNKVNLTTVEGGEAEVYAELLAIDYERIAQKGETSKPLCLTLSLLIKSWNLQAEDGSPLPITEENVGKLNFTDITAIQQYMKDSNFLVEPSATTKN